MHIPHGHSVHHQQMERVGGTPPTASVNHGKPSGPAGGGFAVEDQIDLSESARLFLANGDHASGPGKSMNSAAHRARAVIAENPHLAGMPFGQVVSQLNHGTLDLTPPGGEGEAAAVAVPGEVSGIPAADGEATATVAGDGDGSAFPATAEVDPRRWRRNWRKPGCRWTRAMTPRPMAPRSPTPRGPHYRSSRWSPSIARPVCSTCLTAVTGPKPSRPPDGLVR